MIKSIAVKDLFGYQTYTVPFEEIIGNVFIIHGPNGSGKTTIFKMLQGISQKNFKIFFEVPFIEFEVKTDTMVLKITKNEEGSLIFSNNHEIATLEEQIHRASLEENFDENFRERNRDLHKLGAIRVGPKRYEYEGNEYTYWKLCNMLLRDNNNHNKDYLPEFVSEIAEELNIIYIGAERLISEEESNNQRRVEDNTNKLKGIIKKAEIRYGILSKDLDANFPNRIISKSHSVDNDIAPENIAEKLQNLSLKRNNLTKIGILSESNSNDLIPVDQITSDDILDNTLLKQILSIYIEDNENKLSVFDKLLKKIDVLEEMVNHFFTNKEIEVNSTDGYVIKSTKGNLKGKCIPLNKLSSGEQHFLVLFFELVFNTKKNQIVFIDEPEISLHISWQLNMVDRLIKICQLNSNYFILATHSPSLIRNHRDLAIPVGYEKDDE
ncbi:hypothetical protein COK47_24570 [Bacillus cereus]|uniref:AAA family ATPase n=1 Tax=Bacillus cereus TaxID=1396 RepID=UPI000BF6DC8A|nr:AAA family ATPase [Bacillus cereus]PFN99466.1 hypothetical protein COJ63_23285 [Bacillus cereus]PFS28156.1 hypothetical protein COK47_24570 [Bacillus cereus]